MAYEFAGAVNAHEARSSTHLVCIPRASYVAICVVGEPASCEWDIVTEVIVTEALKTIFHSCNCISFCCTFADARFDSEAPIVSNFESL